MQWIIFLAVRESHFAMGYVDNGKFEQAYRLRQILFVLILFPYSEDEWIGSMSVFKEDDKCFGSFKNTRMAGPNTDVS